MSDVTKINPSSALPLSAATIHNGVVHVSGAVGFKPGTTELAGDDVTSQCRQTLANIEATLTQAGTSKDRLIRCGVYLKNIEQDFAAMNECYSEWLGDHRPARSTIGAHLALPAILIEIDCVAAMP